MSVGFEFYDELAQVQFSSNDVAYLLLDVFDIARPVNGSKSYTLPAGMVLAANWCPNSIAQYVSSFNWSKNTPRVPGQLSIDVSGSVVSWTWSGGSDCNVGSATIRVFAR